MRTKTGGRKPGAINKTTASVKAAVMAAFDQVGGVASLVKWAKANPGAFYALWVKLLPLETHSAPTVPVVVEINLHKQKPSNE